MPFLWYIILYWRGLCVCVCFNLGKRGGTSLLLYILRGKLRLWWMEILQLDAGMDSQKLHTSILGGNVFYVYE